MADMTYPHTKSLRFCDDSGEAIVFINDGKLMIHVGNEVISLGDIVTRLQALEQAYMEDKLLGKKDEK